MGYSPSDTPEGNTTNSNSVTKNENLKKKKVLKLIFHKLKIKVPMNASSGMHRPTDL